MKILDLGQNLYVNPEYIVKIERDRKSVGERVSYIINLYLAYSPNYNNAKITNFETLAFETQEKRDDYFLYLFNLLNESDNKVENKVKKEIKKEAKDNILEM